MQLDEILGGLGLTEGEIKIYLKLLYLGEATASTLGREAKIERRNAYDIARRLMEKGIVSSIEKDRQKIYLPVEPVKLLDVLDEREEVLVKLRQELAKQLPIIQESLAKKNSELDARLLLGREGLKAMFLDEIKTGKTVYIICTSMDQPEEILRYFLPRFTRERVKKNIGLKIITAKGAKSHLDKYGLVDVRFLPDDYISPASITIYGRKIAITIWSGEPVTVLIESDEASESFRNYFRLLWGLAKG